MFFNQHVFVLCFGTENRGFSLVSVPNTEIWVPCQHYEKHTFWKSRLPALLYMSQYE